MTTKSLLTRILGFATVGVLVLTLVGCGGGSNPGTTGSADAGSAGSNTTQQKTPKPKPFTEATLIGDWTALSVKHPQEGIYLTGDLPKAGMGLYLHFDKDGKFEMSYSVDDDKVEGSWKLEDKKVIIKADEKSPVGDMIFSVAEGKYLDLQNDELGMELRFAKGSDVKFDPEYTPNAAQPITDLATIEGSWKLKAMYREGVCMSGNIAAFGMGDMSLSLKADGTGKMTYDDATAAVTVNLEKDGAVIKIKDDTMPVKLADGLLVLDADALLGDNLGTSFFLEKQ